MLQNTLLRFISFVIALITTKHRHRHQNKKLVQVKTPPNNWVMVFVVSSCYTPMLHIWFRIQKSICIRRNTFIDTNSLPCDGHLSKVKSSYGVLWCTVCGKWELISINEWICVTNYPIRFCCRHVWPSYGEISDYDNVMHFNASRVPNRNNKKHWQWSNHKKLQQEFYCIFDRLRMQLFTAHAQYGAEWWNSKF